MKFMLCAGYLYLKWYAGMVNVEAIKVDKVAAAAVQHKYILLPVTLQFL